MGRLGKIHKKCMATTAFELIGCYDPKGVDDADIKAYPSEEALISDCDACLVVSDTTQHFRLAQKVLKMGRHCFVEKPMTSTLSEAEELVDLGDQYPNLVKQVGFVERFNPAVKFVKKEIRAPKFVEVHRLAPFNERGMDVSVIYDLMIHDLDLLLWMMQSAIREIKATGVNVFTELIDICNARIEFEDGSVANVTASRMSMKVMRKFRLFQSDGYISMDLGKKESQITRLYDEAGSETSPLSVGGVEKHVSFSSSGALTGNAIEEELLAFHSAIINKENSLVDFHAAMASMQLASQIESIANENIKLNAYA